MHWLKWLFLDGYSGAKISHSMIIVNVIYSCTWLCLFNSLREIVSEYDQKIPQAQIADKPMAT